MSLIIPGVRVDRRIHSRVLQEPLAASRGGVMLHYDDSSDDAASLAWFRDPRCSNGYTWLVLDDGRVIELADPAFRTPHVGPCLMPRANSVYYGIAAATNGLVPATQNVFIMQIAGPQYRRCVRRIRGSRPSMRRSTASRRKSLMTSSGTGGRLVDYRGGRRCVRSGIRFIGSL